MLKVSRKHCVFASPNLSWTWNNDNPLWIAGPVVDVIASLLLMDDSQLIIVAKAAIPLDRLSGLRNFVDRGPLPPEAIGSRAEVIGNGPDLSHLVITVPSSPTLHQPLACISARHRQQHPYHLDEDGTVYLDLAWARLFCSRLIVHRVHPAQSMLRWHLAGTVHAFMGRLR